MTGEIMFEQARIMAVEHKIVGNAVTSKMKIVAIATPEVACALGAQCLLDRGILVTRGFNVVELDFSMKNLRVTHVVPKISTVVTNSETAFRFRLFRKGDDAKEDKKLMVSFVVQHNGSPFEILEHLMKVGEAEGLCALLPLPSEMFEPEAAPNGKAHRGEQHADAG